LTICIVPPILQMIAREFLYSLFPRLVVHTVSTQSIL
jgi:hypothetical protein